ncbi:MAG: PQQ-binding-like beta-propeller repeat protein [bacterium]
MMDHTNTMITSSRLIYRLCYTLAIIACAFSLIVGMLMAANLLTIRTASPLTLRELTQLQVSLKANPADDAVKDKIRDLDVVARSFYFSGLSSLRSGSLLLLGGVVVALINLKAIVHLRRRQPDPRDFPTLPDSFESAATARWATGGLAVALVVGALILGQRLGEQRRPAGPLALPPTEGSPRPSAGVLPKELDRFEAEAATHWPGFRGRSGSGVSLATNFPITWDGPSGSHIRWKAPTPLPGMSSPVVWGNKIFLTGASAEQRDVFCYDLATGTLLWQMGASPTSGVAKAAPQVNQDTGYAASTPVTDGVFVYSIFANGEVAAIDHCSGLRWTTDLGLPINRYGYASSLAFYNNLVLIQYDNETDKGGVSNLIALEAATGKRRWAIARPVADAWPSPVLVTTPNGPQLVTAANEWIIAYHPESGAELWRVKVSGTDSSSSPIFAGGLVLASVAGDKIYAIRPDGHGDVTATHVAWQSESGVSDVASPVSDGELAYFVNASGGLFCLEVATGKLVWEHSLDGEFYGSPGLAGNHLYLVARSGQVFILKAGRQYEELGRANLGEPSDGSPVFINGTILIRGLKHLFCIGGA